jgi:hypothetical protein
MIYEFLNKLDAFVETDQFLLIEAASLLVAIVAGFIIKHVLDSREVA